MYLLYLMYGQCYPKNVVYACIVTTHHETIDLKHRSSYFGLDPLATLNAILLHKQIYTLHTVTSSGMGEWIPLLIRTAFHNLRLTTVVQKYLYVHRKH